MHRFLTTLTVLFLATAMVLPAAAAETEGRWGAQLESGLWKLVEGYWDHSNVDQFAGLSLRRGLSTHWQAALSYRYGVVRPGVEDPNEDAGLTTNAYRRLYTEIHNPTLDLQYHFLPDARVRPFIGFGLGVTAWRVLESEDGGAFPQGTTLQGFGTEDDQYHKLQRTDVTIATEIGVEWFATDNVSLSLGGRYHILPANDLDNIGYSSWNRFADPAFVDANKGLVQGFVGATFWFGGPKDSDDDGILDDYDRCPRAAEDFDGFQDEDGCPDYDNDGDGIADGEDPCPLDPEDRDGYQDDDGCPDPDNDGDGIIDADDGCPDQAEDLDGFQDDDGCPDPDNDGDGVVDAVDACPDTEPGVQVDERGCPLPAAPLAPEVQAIENGLILEGVSFRSGSAQLTAASIGILSRVADSLKRNTGVRVEVRGHTDSTGSAETNRDLSQRRAMAVRDVLIQLGVSPSRITAVGYGEDYPIVSNETRSGRATNRRVELHRID